MILIVLQAMDLQVNKMEDAVHGEQNVPEISPKRKKDFRRRSYMMGTSFLLMVLSITLYTRLSKYHTTETGTKDQ